MLAAGHNPPPQPRTRQHSGAASVLAFWDKWDFKDVIFQKRTEEVIENKGSGLKTNRKRTEKRSGEVVENIRVHKKRTETNLKTNLAMLLKIKGSEKNEPEQNSSTKSCMPSLHQLSGRHLRCHPAGRFPSRPQPAGSPLRQSYNTRNRPELAPPRRIPAVLLRWPHKSCHARRRRPAKPGVLPPCGEQHPRRQRTLSASVARPGRGRKP